MRATSATAAQSTRAAGSATVAGGSAGVRVNEEAPAELVLRRSMAPSDRLELHVFGAKDGSQARLVAVLDNLGKGASGAAVQNLNLMAGLAETAGLQL